MRLSFYLFAAFTCRCHRRQPCYRTQTSPSAFNERSSKQQGLSPPKRIQKPRVNNAKSKVKRSPTNRRQRTFVGFPFSARTDGRTDERGTGEASDLRQIGSFRTQLYNSRENVVSPWDDQVNDQKTTNVWSVDHAYIHYCTSDFFQRNFFRPSTV
jgi:hypothetical protein